jgi:hypothetical protein
MQFNFLRFFVQSIYKIWAVSVSKWQLFNNPETTDFRRKAFQSVATWKYPALGPKKTVLSWQAYGLNQTGQSLQVRSACTRTAEPMADHAASARGIGCNQESRRILSLTPGPLFAESAIASYANVS